MRKTILLAIAIAIALATPVLWAQEKKALEVYFIDVEGGQSTLFVSPNRTVPAGRHGLGRGTRRRPNCQRVAKTSRASVKSIISS